MMLGKLMRLQMSAMPEEVGTVCYCCARAEVSMLDDWKSGS